MNTEILSVIKYFRIFKYSPDFREIYTFLPIKTSKNSLKMALLRLERQNRIKTVIMGKGSHNESILYTLPEYSIKKLKKMTQSQKKRKLISIKKLDNWRFRAYQKLISQFYQIRLVGLSGSVSMLNAKTSDDIDLFIITAKNRLFTGRLIALGLAQLLGIRREYSVKKNGGSEYQNKVCLNLFFDESDMKIPKYKQTAFVGHEVLQMKPIINKNMTYERFLKLNKWVFKMFPNASQPGSAGKKNRYKYGFIGDIIESVLKKVQMGLINRHKTTEIVTGTQLWFHPEDIGKRFKG